MSFRRPPDRPQDEDRRPRRARPPQEDPDDSVRRAHLRCRTRPGRRVAARDVQRVRRVRQGRRGGHPRRRGPLPDLHRHHRAGDGGKGGDVVTTDGPYAETKEVLNGFYLLECADLDEAIATAARIPGAWHGAVEVRPVIEFGVTLPDPAHAALVRLVRDEGRRVLATLVRHTGDLQLAEDAVQDAVLRALDTWPRTGVPPQPRAWLTLTARNRAVDLVRREAARPGRRPRRCACWSRPPTSRPRCCATTSCGWCSPAATRRWRSRRRSRWPCARSAGCPPPRWAARCSCPRRRWPSA